MKCFNCGKIVKKDDETCKHCGAMLQANNNNEVVVEEKPNKTNETTSNKNKKTSGLGIAGFVVSLCALCFVSLTCGVVGLVLSAVSMGKFDKEKHKNKGFAIAGLVIGIVATAIAFFSKW